MGLLLGNRSWYASATDLAGQFLDKAADMPVASMTGAWGRLCCTAASAVAVLTLVLMSLSCRSSIGIILGSFQWVEWVFFWRFTPFFALLQVV